ncbi:FkbM family methyltransferase [Candidatus Pacearchaeota archaeon]|nr:FkbM family methyltransferase [Candidatus Pacearchaeota archaeon]
MGIRHKIIRFIEQPSGVIDLMTGIKPAHKQYFLTVKKFTDKINTYIDIGANRGDLIKICRKVFPECYVYAVEPIKEHCDNLKKYPNITIFNCGLWNKNMKKIFYHTKKDDMESTLLEPLMLDSNDVKSDIVREEIEVKRFDSLPVKINRPCLVKLDVEGAEDRVLEGMGKMLNEVDFVLIEQIHIKKFSEKITTSKCIKILEDHGFTSFIQIGTTFYPSGFPSKSDLLFLKPRADDVRYVK